PRGARLGCERGHAGYAPAPHAGDLATLCRLRSARLHAVSVGLLRALQKRQNTGCPYGFLPTPSSLENIGARLRDNTFWHRGFHPLSPWQGPYGPVPTRSRQRAGVKVATCRAEAELAATRCAPPAPTQWRRGGRAGRRKPRGPSP